MEEKPIVLIFESYLASIQGAVGTRAFRHLYAIHEGRRQDILKGGKLSCALVASSLLLLFGLVKTRHATVDGTVRDMETAGWKRLRRAKVGAVLVWEEQDAHKHIGFYLGNYRAVSNSAKKKVPIRHHWTFGQKNGKPVRKIESIWWNSLLES